jgi:hypothetical protein
VSALAGAVNGFVVGLIAALVFLGWVDPGRLPENCTTLGSLVQQVAALNYGRLMKMGARHRDGDIWENLTELLSCYALPKAEITRDTVLLEKMFRERAAR